MILIFVSFVKADLENCNVIGECRNAQISHLITAETQLECLGRCIEFDDCQWYTYRYRETKRNCQLFRTCEQLADYDNDCISGQKNCPTDNCRIQGFCLGTLISSLTSLTNAYCDSFCKDEPGCTYYSFSTGLSSPSKRFCYLFQDCPSIDETVVGYESSPVGCPVY